MASILGLLALMLVSLGLYGLSSYIAASRSREIAVRLALGAARFRVAGAVAGRLVLLVTAGVAIGAFGGLWTTGLLETLIFGLSPRDGVAFGVSALVLIGVAAASATLPAARASLAEPAKALRDN